MPFGIFSNRYGTFLLTKNAFMHTITFVDEGAGIIVPEAKI